MRRINRSNGENNRNRSNEGCLTFLWFAVAILLVVCIGIPTLGLIVIGFSPPSDTARHSPATVVAPSQISDEEVNAIRVHSKLPSKKAPAGYTEYDQSRTWIDASGKFATEAIFLRDENGVVELEKTDGIVIRVPLEKLSEGDQEFIEGRKRRTTSSPSITSPNTSQPIVTTSNSTRGEATRGSRQARSGRDYMVRVQVWDDTERNPIHEKSEIWFRGRGSWWIKPATKYGAGAEDLGRWEVGVRFTGDDAIQFYPEGRGGKKINIPLKMTAKMNPAGSVRDSIMITISDNEIEIVGLPIEAATGKVTMKLRR